MTERPLPRDLLPEGVEARAAWAYSHGMVQLELVRRFPPDADLDRAWTKAIDAFTAATG